MTRHFAPSPGAGGDQPRLILPNEIDVLEDGTALAHYGGTPLLRYDSLAELLDGFGLSVGDLNERP